MARPHVATDAFAATPVRVYKRGMIRSMPHPARRLALAATLCWCPLPAAAQTQAAPETAQPPATPDSDTIRLSDEQRDKILDSNTIESAARARGEMEGPGSTGPGIHGEVGAMIGSNGTRGIYGTAAIPLGDNAGAVVSFENSRYGYRR
jgi:hypothetical protein